jgi:hypothetical protein
VLAAAYCREVGWYPGSVSEATTFSSGHRGDWLRPFVCQPGWIAILAVPGHGIRGNLHAYQACARYNSFVRNTAYSSVLSTGRRHPDLATSPHVPSRAITRITRMIDGLGMWPSTLADHLPSSGQARQPRAGWNVLASGLRRRNLSPFWVENRTCVAAITSRMHISTPSRATVGRVNNPDAMGNGQLYHGMLSFAMPLSCRPQV